jgi:hypothetical protein
MSIFGAKSPQSSEPVMVKLIRLARGDVELVDDAIRNAKRADRPADLAQIVKYIVQHRARHLMRSLQEAS